MGVGGRYADLSTRLVRLHNLQLDVNLPAYGMIGINGTLQADAHGVSVDIRVLTSRGQKYQVKAVYKQEWDHVMTQIHYVQLELHMPNQLYTLNTAVSSGNDISITSDLHLDRQRDIHLNLVLDILQPTQTGVQLLFKWDSNRDPNKRMTVNVLYTTPHSGSSTLTINGQLFFLGQEYGITWVSSRLFEYVDSNTIWESKNEGSFTWVEANGNDHAIRANMTIRFRRGDTAEVYSMFNITTPFSQWKENYLEVKYFRTADEIESKLAARWHDGEFIDLHLLAQKEIEGSNFRIETKLDLSSSFEGLISASTGGRLAKQPGIVDTNLYIQWDTDRIEVMLEGKDDSYPELARYSVFGQILTTIDGYREMSTSLDFSLGHEAADVKATVKWEGHFYQVILNGHVYSGNEYLRVGLTVEAVHEQRELVSAMFVVHHDPHTKEEKLTILVQWGEEEVRVEGQVATLPQHFKAGIHIVSTLQELEKAAVVLAYSKDPFTKTEARIQYNDKLDTGFILMGRVRSVADFYVSCTILTPFPGYKTIKGEIRNLFQLSPEVRVHPRIYGQLGEKKYGLGARYEQGQLPRLRVALELYTPLPELHTIFLDLCDNSSHSSVMYDLTMKYGPTTHLTIKVDLQNKEGGLEGRAVAGLPLRSLDQHLEDVTLQASGSYYWQPKTSLDLTLMSQTSSLTKIMVKADFLRKEEGELELWVMTPLDGYDDLNVALQYRLPSDDAPGHLEGKLSTASDRVFRLTADGSYKQLQGSFASPVQPFRQGTFMWKRTAIDILKSRLEAKLGWEDGDLKLDATVKLQGNYIQMLDGTLETPWEDLGRATIRLGGQRQAGGYRNQVILQGVHATYQGQLFWQHRDEHDWEVDIELESEGGGRRQQYTVGLALTNLPRRPFKLAIHVTTPHQGFTNLQLGLQYQRDTLPYTMRLEWAAPGGSGTLDVTFTALSLERTQGQVDLVLREEGEDDQTFQLLLGVTNNSARDMIDVEGQVQLNSNHHYWDNLEVRGKVVQVTRHPGELSLYLRWPRLAPITFQALAVHQDLPSTGLRVQPTITLDLGNARYSFTGEMHRHNQQLNLTGALEWERGAAGPQKVMLHSHFVFHDKSVDGQMTLSLPQVRGWETIKADIHYEARDERHWLKSTIMTGKETTTVTGNMLAEGFPAADGSVTVTSSLAWQNHPLTVTFKQKLSDEEYVGDYSVQWPYKNSTTNTWTVNPIHASLKHRFLEAGHEGTFQITTTFTRNQPIQIDYGFKFPVSGDVSVTLGASYMQVMMKVKVDRVTVLLARGVVKQRTSLEFYNLIWPFGVSVTKEIDRKSDTETETVRTLELYDLDNVSRRFTLTWVRNTAQTGRHSIIKVNALDREIVLDAGYDITPTNFQIRFLLSWAPDEKIEFDIHWQDISKGFSKEHILKGKFLQPLRTVLLDGYYKRSHDNITAVVKYNWDADDPSGEEVVGRLQWTDEGVRGRHHHKAFVTLAHPLLDRDMAVRGELRRNEEEFLAVEGKVEYSADAARDVSMQLLVTGEKAADGTLVVHETAGLLHPVSNLTLRTNGTLSVSGQKGELMQDFLYTTMSGQHHTACLVTSLNLLNRTLQFSLETWRKLVDVVVDVQQDGEGRWRVATSSQPGQTTPLMTYLQVHPTHRLITITFENLLSNHSSRDTSYPRYLAEKVLVEGGLEDQRNARFSLRHLRPAWLSDQQDPQPFWVHDVNFYFRLNNSRLLTSRLNWRPEIQYEVMNELGELMGASYNLRLSLEEWARTMLHRAGAEALNRTRPLLHDLTNVTKPLLVDFRQEYQMFVADMLQLYNSINSTAVEFKVQQSIHFIVSSLLASLGDSPVFQALKERMAARGGSKGQLDQLWTVIHNFLKDLQKPGLGGTLKEFVASFSEKYDQAAKWVYLRAREAVQDFMERLGEWFTGKWRAVYSNYKPHILRTFDEVETNAWRFVGKLEAVLSYVGVEIKASAYYQRLEQIVNYLERIYKDFSEKSKRENLEEFYRMVTARVKQGVTIILSRVAPFVDDWGEELLKAWETLMQYPTPRWLRDIGLLTIDKVVWTVRYVDVRGQVMDALAFMLEHGWTIFTQTSVQAHHRYIPAKTLFMSSPDKGEVVLVQKLPLDWHAFDHRPSWRDLPEYQRVAWVNDYLFSSPNSTTSVTDVWHKIIKFHFTPSSLLPPFHTTGYMIGEQHFMTFDGRPLEFRGRCQHVLAVDLVGGRWAVTVNYHSHTSRTIVVYLNNTVIELANNFRVTVDGVPSELPLGVPSATVHRSLHKLHVDTHHQMWLTWNLVQDVVSITLHGAYFGKTGGLLGLYNYEPYDDLQLPDGQVSDVAVVLAEGWEVSPRQCHSSGNIARPPATTPVPACEILFSSKTSPLKGCFAEVDADPFLNMCLVDYRGQQRDTCTSATAYMEACADSSFPIKIPSYCFQCEYQTSDGQTRTLEEGTPTVLENNLILKSTDVVLLVEVQDCNRLLKEKKPLNRFNTFIEVVNEMLEARGLVDVRYAMVVYGGLEPFSRPVVATVDNQIFTDSENIHRALDHVTFSDEGFIEQYGYMSYDAFLAFSYAAKLSFRAGVTITFVHFPCYSCQPFIPSMDFSTMYHILLEYSVTLHVFSPDLFDLPKAREQKKLLGIDNDAAFTVKDAKVRPGRSLEGDTVIRRQVPMPKDRLVYCAPLALETNGTIFTSSYMQGKRSVSKMKKRVQKLARVFGQRAGETAMSTERKRCVCVPSSPDGAATVECDNWDLGHLSILEEYGYDTNFAIEHETNSAEEGSCIRRDDEGRCLQRIEY